MKPRPESARLRNRRLSGRARRAVEEMLRVDHAGEYGAVAIYRGQQAVFSQSPRTADMAAQLQKMKEEEQKHLDAFDQLLVEREVRPTAMMPLWSVAGYGLGVVTALMGEKAAHACTDAVETVIEQHYAKQAEAVAADDPDLAATFREFREDELHHRDIAVEGGAREARGYRLLSRVIRAGCHAAIRVSEKV